MKRRSVIASIVAIVFCTLICVLYYVFHEYRRHHFQVRFLDVGQGDSALIQFENGKTMLVDCGPDRKILGQLGRSLPIYIRKIDYLLVTHADLDHYGGCIDVIRRYRVDSVLQTSQSKPDKIWKEWEKELMHQQSTILTITSTYSWYQGESVITFLAPDPALIIDDAHQTSNNGSIVFRLDRAETSYMFTGDMEIPLENALIDKYCGENDVCPLMRADVLKVGHHGSSGASGVRFLKYVAPKISIISSGKRNRFGHPSLRVLYRLKRIGATILRTDEMGDILLP